MRPFGRSVRYIGSLVVDETLTRRFGPYFRHPDPDHDVLVVGDRAIACKNVRQALTWVGTERHVSGEPNLYDERLLEAVRRFQQAMGHRSIDGRVGPGTRALLVQQLLQSGGVGRFAELDGSDVKPVPTVFISYAWLDSDRVDKLDQWLQDHGILVLRDSSSFVGGQDIKEAIRTSALKSDKGTRLCGRNPRYAFLTDSRIGD